MSSSRQADTSVTANGIFGSPDDTLDGSPAPDGSKTCAPLLLALAPPAFEDLVFEGPVRVGAVAVRAPSIGPTLKGSLDLDGARLGDGIRPAVRGRCGSASRSTASRSASTWSRRRWQGAHLALSGHGADLVRAPARIVADQRAGDDLRARRRRDAEGAGAVRLEPDALEGDDVRIEALVPVHGRRAGR